MAYLLASLFLLILPLTVRAVCPICTVAVCASLGLSRWLGVDDTITGLWIGGLNISLIIWTIDWLNKKNVRFYGRKILTTAFYYTAILWPLYHYDFIGIVTNKLWGIDKLLLGIIIGSAGFLLGVLLYVYLKKKNNGQAYFPFQKVLMPVGVLIILSLIFYFTCGKL